MFVVCYVLNMAGNGQRRFFLLQFHQVSTQRILNYMHKRNAFFAQLPTEMIIIRRNGKWVARKEPFMAIYEYDSY